MESMTETCIICEDKFTGYDHNPDPISTKGRCCDNCNLLVIASRIKQLYKTI